MLLDTILGYAASLVMVLQGISLLSVTYTSPTMICSNIFANIYNAPMNNMHPSCDFFNSVHLPVSVCLYI